MPPLHTVPYVTMAKWGEGDPRWIVEERADAHNVNNWHWRESDATQWSKNRFRTLLDGMKVEDENVGCCTLSSVSCEGEASVSNRKNKIICFYEWSIKAKWKGRAKGDDRYYNGDLLIEGMSEEYSPEEVDVEIKVPKENSESKELNVLMKTLGVSLVKEKLRLYLDALRNEYATQLILLPNDTKSDSKNNTVSGSMKSKMEKLTVNDAMKEPEKNSCGIKISTKKVKMSETFMTTVEELFLTLTQKERVSAWSRSEVKDSAAVGSTMVLFDKNIEVEFTELAQKERIVMKWRMKSWYAGHYSVVKMSLSQTVDGARLTLEQSGVPETALDATLNGWKRYYWEAIKMTFGYGTRIM